MHRIHYYIALAIAFMVITTILYLPIYFLLKKSGKGGIRQCSYLLLFWSSFLILYATVLFVRPINFHPEQYILNFQPFLWLTEGNTRNRFVREIITNILMFVPFGFSLPVVCKSLRKFYMTAAVVFLVTFGVEFFQYFIGRSADIDDLMLNFAGGLLGYGLFQILGAVCKNATWWKKFTGKA